VDSEGTAGVGAGFDAELAREQTSVRDAYGLALVCLLISVLGIIMAGAPVSSPMAVGATAFQFIALALTLRVSGVRRGSYLGGMALTFMGFVAAAILLSQATTTTTTIAVAMWLVLLLAAIASIAKRLATYSTVTLQLVLGLLCVYLLIGLSFGFTYLLIDIRVPESFSPHPLHVSGCIYYSFITLATVGYGDISPVSSVARGFAVAESILGQLYLVSVVSLAVSRLGMGMRRQGPEGSQ